MAMLRVEKATMEMWEDAYEVFYRALKKLISEGKPNLFGGMTPNDVKDSLEDGRRRSASRHV